MPEQKRILLLIEASRAYGRGCLSGVSSYVRAHPGWRVLHISPESTQRVSAFIRGWRGDGVLSRVETREAAEAIEQLGVPTVDLRGQYPISGGARLDTDPAATAALACQHLLERGFQNFAYCGYAGLTYCQERCEAFTSFLRQRGLDAFVYAPPSEAARRAAITLSHEAYGETHVEQLVPWLEQLPKPVGIMACNDARGRQVICACGLAGIKAPQEAAVVGVDNDEVICELAEPPLSSVALNTHRVGYEGARLLDAMIDGRAATPEGTIHIPPERVQARLSTDVLAVEDRDLVAALEIIRENACAGINVNDVIRMSAMSRSTLERRFQKHLGCGPKDLILKVRFDKVMTLLRETDYELNKIARLCGFRTAAHLVSAFKQHTGVTPGQYRAGCGSAAP